MSEQENKRENKTGEIDLSELSNLQFSTAWTPSSSISPSPRGSGSFKGPKRDGRRPGRPRDGGDFKKRPFRDRRDGGERPGSDRPFKRRPKPFDMKAKKEPFAFSMEVLFYPEDTPFNKLSDIMKASKRTYQLFDIAEIILEKPERFVVLAKNLPDADGNAKPLYCAQPLNLPFEDEAAAKAAAIDARFDELFSAEETDAEPPKGEFQVVNRCSITGDLLGAPNWHKYAETVREYHGRKFPKMPFEKFSASIEGVRDADQIAAWLETMKKKTVFKLKEPREGDPESFDTREAARAYIAERFGAELVKTYEQVRMRGEYVAKLPFGRIRRNIEEACRKQKKFPIVTANNLRGRLRRSGFAVYKRGSKGFAFVSTIKRKFIFEGESLSEVPQKIFDFITANPAIRASDLPYKYLGLEAPKSEAKSKTLAQEHSDGAETLESQKPAESAELPGETREKLSSVWSELSWLVSEGYVVEYADGTLQANPYLPKPKDKAQAADPEAEAAKAGDEPIIAPKEKAETAGEKSPEDSATAEPAESAGEPPAESCAGEPAETPAPPASEESEDKAAELENGAEAADAAAGEPAEAAGEAASSGEKPADPPEGADANAGAENPEEKPSA